MSHKIKICGATRQEEIDLLAHLGVSYVGLWYGIPIGRHNLSLEKLTKLSNHCNDSLKPVLVTVSSNVDMLDYAFGKSGIQHIQFHGFQTPGFIKRFKRKFGDSIKVFKVLHVKSGRCIEEAFIERYLNAGTDYFILDSFKDAKNIGSTGTPIDSEFLLDFLSRNQIRDRTMIAGGIDSHNIASFLGNFKPYGVDVDTAARKLGTINRQCVEKLVSNASHILPISPTAAHAEHFSTYHTENRTYSSM